MVQREAQDLLLLAGLLKAQDVGQAVVVLLLLLLPVMFLNRTKGPVFVRRPAYGQHYRRTPYAGFRMVALLSFLCS